MQSERKIFAIILVMVFAITLSIPVLAASYGTEAESDALFVRVNTEFIFFEEIDEPVPIADTDVPLGELPHSGISLIYQVLLLTGVILVGTGVIAGYIIRKRSKSSDV